VLVQAEMGERALSANEYARAGRYADALVMISRARAIVEETWGPRSPLLLAVLTNETVVLHKLGRNAEARVAYERAR
jgi:Flp pilus assembly protein TadD